MFPEQAFPTAHVRPELRHVEGQLVTLRTSGVADARLVGIQRFQDHDEPDKRGGLLVVQQQRRAVHRRFSG